METLDMLTLDGHATTVDESTLMTFAANLKGDLVRPGDADYEQARLVWNGMIDRHPALVVRCATESDVIAAVNFARTHDLLVAVRGGGHNVAGYATCDGGLLIDLSPMKAVEVDLERKTVRAEAGCRWGDVDRATQAYGLATPGGVVSDTGIAGLTLGGGFGWLSGTCGLSCDALVSARVVTANGRLYTASATENADLFWAIRGGGGNFGIVTRFEYRLYEVGPEVMMGFVFHDGRGARMEQALRAFRDYCATAPDEATALAACGIIPPGSEVFPENIHGLPFVLLGAMYAGPVDEGERVLAPLRTFAEPLIDFSGPMPYVEAQTLFDEDYPAHEMRYYWKSLNLNGLGDEVIARIVAHARRQPSVHATTDLWCVKGAVRRQSEDAMAFSGRGVPFILNPEANWHDPEDDDANLTWVRDFIADMQPFSDGGRYLNFPGFHEEGEATMRATFGAKYARLAALKRKYDPTNLFRLNQNVRPE